MRPAVLLCCLLPACAFDIPRTDYECTTALRPTLDEDTHEVDGAMFSLNCKEVIK